MGEISVNRINEFANRGRKISLYLDGKELSKIGNGKTEFFTVSNGLHTLQAKIDWCRSNVISFVIDEGSKKNFKLTSFAKGKVPGGLSSLYYIIIKPDQYLELNEVTI
jgi:hypothetical protein